VHIVSLLPSATEVLFALGLGEQVAGVSHECDYPPAARQKKVVIHSRIPAGISPGEIDCAVREFVARGESLYAVDADALQALAPDLIITQDLCHVCAASPDDLKAALGKLGRAPRVLSLNPQSFADVWRDILSVGKETGVYGRAQSLVSELESRILAVEARIGHAAKRPTAVFLEWLDPFYVGGHWVPEMMERAGGADLLGKARTPSFRVTAEQIVSAAPEVLFVASCGYSAEQSRNEYLGMPLPPGWETIPAVRDGRVFALEASGYFSRPGPRLVEGLETLARLFHPEVWAEKADPSPVLGIESRPLPARVALA